MFIVFQISGARIKISDKGDFMTGTSDRYVLKFTFTSLLIADEIPFELNVD